VKQFLRFLTLIISVSAMGVVWAQQEPATSPFKVTTPFCAITLMLCA